MKKQLLFGSALLAAISAFSQRPQERPISPPNTLGHYIEPTASSPAAAPVGPVNNPANHTPAAKTASSSIQWDAISGSMNVFGVITTQQAPLQYNDDLDAVSFIHRKSPTYVANPVPSPSQAVTGVIVAMVTQNWGADWDSTAIWNNNLQHARYPQGGLYNANPMGQTSLANAYAIATGPITQVNASLGWIGNYFASKKLDVVHGSGWDSTASSVTGAQQFIPNSSPFMTNGVNKVDFLRNDFAAPKDGNVWAIGDIMANANGGSLAANQTTGGRLIKGTFVSGVFTLSGDSIFPNVVTTAANAPAPASTPLVFNPRMAWSESGEVGYVYFLGCRAGATGKNVGIQPIVYRTVNHGQTWNPIAGINFNDPKFVTPVLDHIDGTSSDTTFKIPQFDDLFATSCGIDAVVDYKGALHIGAVIVGATKKSTDSMFVTSHSYSLSSDNETGYSFAHIPGHRPYIFDFVSPTPTAATADWSVTVIDSMATEGPGTGAGTAGVNDNPWDVNPDGNTKGGSNSRLQLSATAGGKYILYSWADSDTNFTNGGRKWNHLPNVKVNLLDVDSNKTANANIDITNPNTGPLNTNVASNAQNHYMSPKCKLVGTTTATVPGPSPNVTFTEKYVDVKLPMTVTNSIPLKQLAPNTHYYASAALQFTVVLAKTETIVGVPETNMEIMNSVVFPNPAKDNATLVMNTKQSGNVDVVIMNTVGQTVKSFKVDTQVGENNIDLDVKGLATGIYFVNVKNGNASGTKKLIIE